VYGDHVDFVWRNAIRLGVAEAAADDVAQQVFLVVHRRLSEFEGRSSVKTWILSILLRVVREYQRGVRRKTPHWLHDPVDPDLVPDTADDPHEALTRAEAARVIDELLDSLDQDKRVVFVLAELEQMTAREISEATGLTPRAVYSRLRAARTDFERAAARVRRRALRGTQ
jgi:RNA polymerase sigma-70 factor (ECF subfamily)